MGVLPEVVDGLCKAVASSHDRHRSILRMLLPQLPGSVVVWHDVASLADDLPMSPV